jgi:serine phosphatase RsbU (regulator of sigma subunit)
MARTNCLLLVGLLPLLAATGNAQNSQPLPAPIEMTLGQAAAPLFGPWKFTVGDSPIDPKTGKPLWAEPDFDDSRWETIVLTPEKGPADVTDEYVPGWAAKGHPGYSGYAWYRIQVACHTRAGQRLALEGPDAFDDGYQVFDDGELLGSFGDFNRRRPVVYIAQPAKYGLEPGAEPNKTRVIAFRFWMESLTLILDPDAGGMHSPPVLGEAGFIALDYQSKRAELVKAFLPDGVSALAFALLAGMALSIIFFDPSDPTYLWIGLLFFATAVWTAETALSSLTELFSITEYLLFGDILPPIIYALWVVVWWFWFGREGFRWMPRAIVALTVLLMISRVLEDEVFFVVSHPVAHAISRVLQLVFFGLLVWIVVDAIRRHRLDGWFVVPIVILRAMGSFYLDLVKLHINLSWFLFGIQLDLRRIADPLIAVVIALLLLRRLKQSVKRQKQMTLDFKQAKEVQEVILPERRIVLPGLQIESEYRPAREVGGDFFQVIPHAADSSLLVVAGDVAGKGLKAGMLVALLVGAIRTAAEIGSDPAAILAALNRRLTGRGDAVATCLALSIACDGAATLANAGHPPPYLNGQPMEIEGSLPLGILENLDCSVLKFHMSPGDRILLLSDGIAEATNGRGKLFGFDQVLELVRADPSAQQIAEAAQSFGHEDDISVISVTRVAEPVLA